MRPQLTETGWELVAQRDEAASLIGAVVELDPGTEYTRSDIADAADIPLKTLYLADALEDLVDIGALDHTEEADAEATFVVNEDSDVVRAARQFDDAVAAQLDTAE
ncbi:hypothetical protein [Salinibaculum rarum]|uniref:hypothetical protein n=1 Tax=Salinibaculum rarum TaxID=3058903 RepID=UPI00265E824B|nr:hypothetical protein [Salinibaculum sp. KK48]